MLLSRQKLKKYLFIIRHHIPNHYSDELNQALTGIEELCSFLDVKFIESNDQLPQPVDPAAEADEAAQMKSQIKYQRQISHHQISNLAQNESTLRQKSLESCNNLKINKTEIKDIHKNLSAIDNVTIWNPMQQSSSNQRTLYEIPDNSFMKYSRKFLGTAKEFELKEFSSDYAKDEKFDGIPVADPIGIRDNNN